MNSEEIMFQQYKMYAEQKENFIDRSFRTNKFYMVLILLLVLVMFGTKGFTFAFGLTSTLIYAFAGICICTLWWINMDAYNMLIKVKLSKVLEEIEKSLPVKPYANEFEAVTDLRKNRKMFLFSDMQKIFAIVAFLLFLVLFINELAPFIYKVWYV